MPSTSMPPPPAPALRRRSRVPTDASFPQTPPYSPESSPCVRKMSLLKGATFHAPSSPPAEDDPVLSIAHLARRSPTGSQSSLLSLISDKEGVAARSIEDFERTFSGARRRPQTQRRVSDEFVRPAAASLPSDEGLGSSISGSSEKGLAKSFERVLDLVSDSALGTSVDDGSLKGETSRLPTSATRHADPGATFEDDGLSAQDLIQGADHRFSVPLPTRQRGNQTLKSSTSITRSAVTQSISPQSHQRSSRQPSLSNLARKKLAENILDPLLREDRFELFHPLVDSFKSTTNKHITCLRDLEKSLISEPLTLDVPRRLYRTFGEFSIQLVIDTYPHLSEPEQRRASDRPYDNGYFLDLVQQVGRLSAHITGAREARAAREEADEPAEEDEMAFSTDDEVTLEGGIGSTGQVAELVRWKNGKGTSLRTNEPYEGVPALKRQHSDLASDEDVARSMARRKKNAEPKVVELRCSDDSCDKIFTRKCDLAKHEKTHSRPFKCPEPTCKYHDQGLPTEKERDRHINDKHSSNPHFYHCKYCPFKTKRDSNCKQHMEKKHGWTYERVKGISKMGKTPAQTPQQTPQTPLQHEFSASPTSASNIYSGGSSVADSVRGTPYEQPLSAFGGSIAGPSAQQPYRGPSLFPSAVDDDLYGTSIEPFDFSAPLETPPRSHHTVNYGATFSNTPYAPQYTHTPITPAHTGSGSFDPSPYLDSIHMDIRYGNQPMTYSTGIPTPGSNFLQPNSRNPSISYESPLHSTEPMFSAGPSGLQSLHGNAFGSHNALPVDDFDLFDASGSATLYPSTTDADMFPDMETMQYQYEQETTQTLDQYLNIDNVNGTY